MEFGKGIEVRRGWRNGRREDRWAGPFVSQGELKSGAYNGGLERAMAAKDGRVLMGDGGEK